MTNELEKFVLLTKQASDEASPPIDVRGSVLASLSAAASSTYTDRIAIRFLVGSMSFAFVAMAVVSLLGIQDPPMEMVMPFVSSLP